MIALLEATMEICQGVLEVCSEAEDSDKQVARVEDLRRLSASHSARATRIARRQHRLRRSAAQEVRTRQRGARPRERRSARTGSSSSTSGSDPGASDSDPPPPLELRLWRHPRYGLCSPNLLHILEATR